MMKNTVSAYKRAVALAVAIDSIFVGVLIPFPASASGEWAITSPVNGSQLTNCSFTILGFLPTGSVGYLFLIDNDDLGQTGPIGVVGPKFLKSVTWANDDGEDLAHVTVLLA